MDRIKKEDKRSKTPNQNKLKAFLFSRIFGFYSLARNWIEGVEMKYEATISILKLQKNWQTQNGTRSRVDIEQHSL